MEFIFFILGLLTLAGSFIVSLDQPTPVIFFAGIVASILFFGFGSVIRLLRQIRDSFLDVQEKLTSNTKTLEQLVRQSSQEISSEDNNKQKEPKANNEHSQDLFGPTPVVKNKEYSDKSTDKDSGFNAEHELKALRRLVDEGIISQEHYNERENQLLK